MKDSPSPLPVQTKGTPAYIPRLWPLDTSITEVRSRLSRMRTYRDYAVERGLSHMVVTPEFIEQRLAEADVPKKQWAALIKMVIADGHCKIVIPNLLQKSVTAEDVDSEPEVEIYDLPVPGVTPESVIDDSPLHTTHQASKSLKKPTA